MAGWCFGVWDLRHLSHAVTVTAQDEGFLGSAGALGYWKIKGLFSTHIMVTFIATTGMSWSWAPSQSSSRSLHWQSSGTTPSTGGREERGKSKDTSIKWTSCRVPGCRDCSCLKEWQLSGAGRGCESWELIKSGLRQESIPGPGLWRELIEYS